MSARETAAPCLLKRSQSSHEILCGSFVASCWSAKHWKVVTCRFRNFCTGEEVKWTRMISSPWFLRISRSQLMWAMQGCHTFHSVWIGEIVSWWSIVIHYDSPSFITPMQRPSKTPIIGRSLLRPMSRNAPKEKVSPQMLNSVPTWNPNTNEW